ncbi:hypothetical protein GCM10009678_31050 [Actinomadura kijaniata]|uniref:Uncharacterized protein n=1 Tax=Actinomadura namibiensis TaxID=182080 RepID=A0A7W3QMF1_ACTNM|nr:hypothetical protein [Actinomadura namibiensis]MBA8951928.1 hypothetical protein [Actinomadura namibiensis]
MNARRLTAVALGVALGAVLSAAPLTVAVAPASAEAARTSAGCPGRQTWSDENTFGVMCPTRSIGAAAYCRNKVLVYGRKAPASRWSYAYCAAHGGLARPAL